MHAAQTMTSYFPLKDLASCFMRRWTFRLFVNRDIVVNRARFALAGNRQDIHRDERHSGGSADQPEGVRAEHHRVQAQHRPAGGRPPAHPGGPHL